MSDTPKRRWFQFHLSTTILMMFVAGGFVGSNFIGKRLDSFNYRDDMAPSMYSFEYGWPFIVCKRIGELEQAEGFVSSSEGAVFRLPSSQWRIKGIINNALILIVTLVAAAAVCECLQNVDKNAKRRVWQIHLSTAVLLSFAVGGFLWANATGKLIGDGSRNLWYGWPYEVYREFVEFGPLDDTERWFGWTTMGVVKNSILGASVVFTFGLLCEFIIRRREARKT